MWLTVLVQWANHIGGSLPRPPTRGKWQVESCKCGLPKISMVIRVCRNVFVTRTLCFSFFCCVFMFFAHKLLAFLNLSQQFVCWSARQPASQRVRTTVWAHEIMRQLIALVVVVVVVGLAVVAVALILLPLSLLLLSWLFPVHTMPLIGWQHNQMCNFLCTTTAWKFNYKLHIYIFERHEMMHCISAGRQGFIWLWI